MQRLDYYRIAPEPINALTRCSELLTASTLPALLRLLVEIRVSQINGCGYCVDLHSRQARQHGESQARLDALPVWQLSPFFTPAERAALAWTESLTAVATTRAPDADFATLGAHFTEREIVELSLVIAAMNAWNRIAIGFRKEPAVPGRTAESGRG